MNRFTARPRRVLAALALLLVALGGSRASASSCALGAGGARPACCRAETCCCGPAGHRVQSLPAAARPAHVAAFRASSSEPTPAGSAVCRCRRPIPAAPRPAPASSSPEVRAAVVGSELSAGATLCARPAMKSPGRRGDPAGAETPVYLRVGRLRF